MNCLIRRRHHYRLRIRKGRMYMECVDCGSRSQGWEMGPKARPLAPRRSPGSELRLWLDDAVATSDTDSTPVVASPPVAPPGELRIQLDS